MNSLFTPHIRPSETFVRQAYQKAQRQMSGIPDSAKKAQVTDPQGNVVAETYYIEHSRLDHYA